MHDCLETVVMASTGSQWCLSEVISVGNQWVWGGPFPILNSVGSEAVGKAVCGRDVAFPI